MAGLTSMSRLFQRKQLINILKLISKPSSYAASRAVAPKVLACGGRQVQWRSGEIRRHDSSCVKRTDLNYEDILALLGTGNLQLIDVRETKELDEQGKFPTALNIPLSCLKATLLLTDENFRLMFNIPKPSPHDDDIVFVGFGPVKSNTALEIAHKLGFKNLSWLKTSDVVHVCFKELRPFHFGQVESALNMPPHTFKALYGRDQPELDDENIVFACLAGVRSFKAMQIAHKIGYSNARQYAGGFQEWTEKTSGTEV